MRETRIVSNQNNLPGISVKRTTLIVEPPSLPGLIAPRTNEYLSPFLFKPIQNQKEWSSSLSIFHKVCNYFINGLFINIDIFKQRDKYDSCLNNYFDIAFIPPSVLILKFKFFFNFRMPKVGYLS